MSSPSVKSTAIVLALFALAVYLGYIVWIGFRF
jgi:uncharacterized membrane protein (DUF485 family)